MKTLMRNGRDRRSENPFLGHARKERVSLFGTDQRITSGPAATRLHSKAEYMTHPNASLIVRFLLHRGRRPYMTQSRHLMMKLQAVGIVPRSITYSRGSRLRD